MRIEPQEALAGVRPQLYIGGEWMDSDSGDRFASINPATGEVLLELQGGSADDVDRAVAAARRAFRGEWAALSARKRGRLVWELGEALRHDLESVALLETLDNGKPIFESRYVDIPTCADILQYYAGWADKIHGETIAVGGTVLDYTVREPLGVVGCIVPWNFPLLLAVWKLAPALATGNTVLLKPASETSLSALRLAQLAHEVGFPAGVLNVVTGSGARVGTAIVQHPGIDKVAFTGATATGQGIMRAAADTLKHVTLELGGKSPNIIFADADLDAAVKGATNGIFYGKGEVCAAGSRLLVQRSVLEEVVQRVVERTQRLAPGDPLDPKTRLGALVSERQLESVLGYVEAGQSDGARLLTGGARASVGDGRGAFMTPAVFDQVDNSMRIAQEEIFGPVLAVIPFEDDGDAVEQANGNPYGLAAGVWTRDIGRAHRVAGKLQAGTVWVNTYNRYDPAAPFGGYKASGYGRELGMHALEYYTQVKNVWVDLGG